MNMNVWSTLVSKASGISIAGTIHCISDEITPLTCYVP